VFDLVKLLHVGGRTPIVDLARSLDYRECFNPGAVWAYRT